MDAPRLPRGAHQVKRIASLFGGRLWSVALVLALALATVALARRFPFAFYSPDGSFHAAKLLRATEGQPFLDPFSGTPSLYPAFFHWSHGGLARLLGLEPLPLYHLVGIVDFLALHGTFFLVALSVLRSREQAAFATLLLPLLYYAPSGRHVLVANPANLGLPLLLAGTATLAVSLGGKWLALLGGLLLVSLAANTVWYLALPASALVVVRLLLRQDWRASPRRLASVGAALLAPCLFTLWQLWSIRTALPDYRSFAATELQRHGGEALEPRLVGEWLVVLVTKNNTRFEGVLARDRLAQVHYLVGVLPFAALVAAVNAVALLGRHGSTPGLTMLSWSGGVTLALSFGFALTRDFPRVAAVQFAGWVFLAPRAVAWLSERSPAARAAAYLTLSALGVLGLFFTVSHGERTFQAGPSPATRAVIHWIGKLPQHGDERIWVSESNLRELAPFVSFKSFVNHGDGRYYAQDPVSSAALLRSYRSIRDHGEDWRRAIDENQVRFLAFRHSDPRDREIGLFYLGQGRALVQNSEWWVVEIEAR